MGSSTYLYACAIFTALIISSEAESNVGLKALTDTLIRDLGTESSADSSEASREISKYFNQLTKAQAKFYKKQHRKEISEEEKREVKYYEEMLKKIQSINAQGRRQQHHSY